MSFIMESFAEDIVLIIVSSIIFIYWYFTNNFDYWEQRNVPFPKPKPFFGNYKDRLLFKKSSAQVLEDLYKEMEEHKLFGMWMVKKPVLIIRDPELIKHVFVKDFAYFHDRGMTVDEEKSPLSANLFNLSGSKWRTLRMKLTPTFTSGKMKMMFALMHECALEFVNFVDEESRPNEEVEFKEIFAKLTTDIIGSCAFGLQFNSMKDPNSEFRKMGRKSFTSSKKFIIGHIVRSFSPLMGKLFDTSFPQKDVSDFFIKAVKDTVEYRETNKVTRNDFLQLLIELKNKGRVDDEDHDHKVPDSEMVGEDSDVNNFELTENLLAAQAFVFFLAGFETSSTTMSFALHELVSNPDVQDKLREEIDSVLEESAGELTYDALRKMEYLENVVNESMRKYPPLGVLFRVCNKAYVEPDTGARVDVGTRVHIPVLALHRDPKYYPDPERFDPDRFSEEQRARRHPYAFLPFGEGPRICIGMRFGMLQAKLGLAALLSRFELAASPRSPHPLTLDPKAFITSSDGGIWARVTRRNIAPSVRRPGTKGL